MTGFSRSYTTSYQSAIVSVALSCTILEFFVIEEYRDLQIWVRVTQKMAPFDRLHTNNSSFIVSCIVSEISGKKSQYIYSNRLVKRLQMFAHCFLTTERDPETSMQFEQSLQESPLFTHWPSELQTDRRTDRKKRSQQRNIHCVWKKRTAVFWP